MKILVIDIGNTSSTLGVFSNGRVRNVTRVENNDPHKKSIQDAVSRAIGKSKIDGVCVASVVPSLNRRWEIIVQEILSLKPIFVTHRTNLGVKITYPKPSTIGADRLANAVGGVEKYGAPVIVGDFGTAVTFDVITKREGYIGGIIAPGPSLMSDYLSEKTELLPRVEWKALKKPVGKNTKEAMQLGSYWGYRGLFKEILRELKSSPELKRARVIATGGFAPRVLEGFSTKIVIDPTLTLYGLGCIYMRNFEQDS